MGCHNVVQEGKVTGLFLDADWCEHQRRVMKSYNDLIVRAAQRKHWAQVKILIRAREYNTPWVLRHLLYDTNYKFV